MFKELKEIFCFLELILCSFFGCSSLTPSKMIILNSLLSRMRTPPLIRTKDDVKAKIQMLEALADIEIAMKIIKEEGADDVNPIDSHYTSLKCDLQALDKTHPEFEVGIRFRLVCLNYGSTLDNMYHFIGQNL